MSHIIHNPVGPRSPVVFDSPHSGTTLCENFRHACAPEAMRHYHDPHIEKLLSGIPATGAPVLEALTHRVCIDLNRFIDEIDTATLQGNWPHPAHRTKYTDRHIGLFPVMTGPVWDRTIPVYDAAAPLTVAQAEDRIKTVYQPYFQSLDHLMTAASNLHGQALLVDTHSYYRCEGLDRPDIIIGDMNGTSCSPVITMAAADLFRKHGLSVSFNHPYGNAVIRAAADFSRDHHSLQIEIARDLYMDQQSFAYDEKKAQPLKTALNELSVKMARLLTL